MSKQTGPWKNYSTPRTASQSNGIRNVTPEIITIERSLIKRYRGGSIIIYEFVTRDEITRICNCNKGERVFFL